MGHWGVKSYENDYASDALDAGFDRVHGAAYETLMDDRSPLSFEQVHARLASTDTLVAALDALHEAVGGTLDDYDEIARLAYAGVVVCHAELGIPITADVRARARRWLEEEDIDWDESTIRRLRRNKEIALLGDDHAADEGRGTGKKVRDEE